jgi:conjugative transfer signal peptidase TraF
MTKPRKSSSPLPLFRWGDEIRAAWARRRRLLRRSALLGGLALMLGLTIALPPRPLLLWNASASAPVGLYTIGDGEHVQTGDMVIAWAPDAMRQLAARRHYLPANVPLVKRIAAEPGDTVCAFGPTITVNGKRVAERHRVDGMGRPMPWWSGCITLRRGALFLLMTGSPASFDGRYFGPTGRGDIVGKATLLWAR